MLHALAVQGESPQLRKLCAELHATLQKGQPLSQAFRQSARFAPGVLGLLVCAEQSGQLATVLARLSEQLDDSHRRRLRLRQALIYPAFVLSACLSQGVLMPAYVLRDQLLGHAARGPLPWPTQVLVLIGDVARSGWTWALQLLAAGLLPALLARLPLGRLRGTYHRILLGNGLTRRFCQAQVEVVLGINLSLQIEAGIPLLRALHSSLVARNSPLIEAQLSEIIQHASEGQPLASVLEKIPGIGRRFCAMVAAGEECGHVSQAVICWWSGDCSRFLGIGSAAPVAACWPAGFRFLSKLSCC